MKAFNFFHLFSKNKNKEENIIKQINELALHPKIKEYINNAYSIQREDDDPFLTYFGINYRNDEILNFKVYFEFHNKLSNEDLSKLLPNTDDLLEHYDKAGLGKIHDTHHMGVTFAIKITPQKKTTHYFHCIIPGKAGRLPEKIKLHDEEVNHMNNIVSREYTDNEVFIKNYNIVWTKKNLEKLVKRFNISNNIFKLKSFEHIEYTETDKFDKIILGIKDPKDHEKYVRSLPPSGMKSVINHICNKYNLMTASAAIYEDGETRAIYFVHKKDKIFYTTNDTITELRTSLFESGV